MVEKNEKYDMDIVKCFLSEGKELVDEFEHVLLDFDKGQKTPEVIGKLFRMMHNLKGASKTAGFSRLTDFCHSIENVLQNVRNGKLNPSKEVCSSLFKALDLLKAYIAGIGVDVNFTTDTSFIEKELKFITTATVMGEKGDQKSAIIMTMTQDSPVTKNVSTIESANANANAKPKTEVKDVVIGKLVEAPIAKIAVANNSNSISSIMEESIVEKGVITEDQIDKSFQIQKNGNGNSNGAGAGSNSAGTGAAGSVREEQIRVGLWRLDTLINFIGELIIYHSMIKERTSQLNIDDSILLEAISYMGKVVKEIQSISLSLRMIPIKSVFKKMQRTVRTIAELQNKRVNFITEGEDVELDKVVVDMIGDPLTHLIRNALDHGIETPEERIKKGKDPEATLTLKAEHKEGNVYITVKDDGRGIDRERVWNKAVEKGLVPASKKRDFTEDEMLRILTLPGFSTKEEVSEISGRGVGLDVVRTTIEGIKGNFWIDSTIDLGTTFYINIPLTLSIIEGMVISLENMKYVVPMGQLVETINNSRYITVSSAGKGRMINLRGEVIPVLDLAKMIHGSRCRSNDDGEEKPQADFSGLVINYGGRKVSLEVENVFSQQQIVIKNLGKELVDIPGIIGGFILGDGEAGLILNLPEIVKYNAHLIEKNSDKVAYN
ncbi:MAG: chemotaxis protein CheA [Oligoflexia bacterium]|nr:chemotaxis protein CheA [Oligoflexia bacterium]